MTNIKNLINQIAKSENFGVRCKVVKTYTKKQQIDDTGVYVPAKHITCDVVSLVDETPIFGVRLRPETIGENDTVFDGSAESKEGTVYVDIPEIESTIFVNWLNKDRAFVIGKLVSASSIVGSKNAYFNFFNDENIEVVELYGVDKCVLLAKESTIIITENIELSANSKIKIENKTQNIKTQFSDILGQLEDFINSATPILAAVDPTITARSAETLVSINQTKINVDALFD